MLLFLLLLVANLLIITSLSGSSHVFSNQLSVLGQMAQVFHHFKTLRNFSLPRLFCLMKLLPQVNSAIKYAANRGVVHCEHLLRTATKKPTFLRFLLTVRLVFSGFLVFRVSRFLSTVVFLVVFCAHRVFSYFCHCFLVLHPNVA